MNILLTQIGYYVAAINFEYMPYTCLFTRPGNNDDMFDTIPDTYAVSYPLDTTDVYIYIYVYTCMYTYMYLSLSLYIHIYIYIYRERERSSIQVPLAARETT